MYSNYWASSLKTKKKIQVFLQAGKFVPVTGDGSYERSIPSLNTERSPFYKQACVKFPISEYCCVVQPQSHGRLYDTTLELLQK